MIETTDDSDAALVADLADSRNEIGNSIEGLIDANGYDNGPANKRRKIKHKSGKSAADTSEARKESHKMIERKRREKINVKINELRELLNYPDGSQNKAVVLQAAVDNIKNLKVVCGKLLSSHQQLQEEYLHILQENERLRKGEPLEGVKFPSFPLPYNEDKKDINRTILSTPGFNSSNTMEFRPVDINNVPYLYEEPMTSRALQFGQLPAIGRDGYQVTGRDGYQLMGRDGYSSTLNHAETTTPSDMDRQSSTTKRMIYDSDQT